MNLRLIYLHGFASGPGSKKARMFAGWFKEKGVELSVPALDGGDFRNLTLTGQLEVIEREAQGQPCALIGSSLGGYLAALYAARREEVQRLVLLAPAFGFARRWAASLGAGALEEGGAIRPPPAQPPGPETGRAKSIFLVMSSPQDTRQSLRTTDSQIPRGTRSPPEGQ